MTPLEKAVEASARIFEGTYSLSEDEVRAIIRAFLEAAAEDHDITNDIGLDVLPLVGDEGLSDIGKAAILALKETING